MDKELREEFRAWKIEIEDMLRLLTERVAALENATSAPSYGRKAKQETAISGNGE